MTSSGSWPILGCGVGLRTPHYPVITEKWPPMDWFEAVSENYMDTGGRPLHILEKVRHHYPIALHGTALSIGSSDPLNPNYLKRLKGLMERIDPFIVSDHLCWSGVHGEALHDLLPLPFTEEAIAHVVKRVEHVQEFLGRRILLENVSTYVTYRHSVMTEWEFLREVAKRSGCGILLDLNNIYVNAFNHHFDPHEYVRNVPGELIGQIHLAGHTDRGSFLFDTHSAPVIDAVWELYRETLSLWGPISTLIEWDEEIPPFERLKEEAERARGIYREFEAKGVSPKSLPLTLPSPLGGEGKGEGHSEISLSELQSWMKSQIQPRESPPKAPFSGESLLNPQGGVSGEERMAVYSEGYLARIRESLSEVYRAILQALGPDPFSSLSKDYARRFLSHDYNLNSVGKNLPEFLETLPLSQSFPFLPDLAKLEWLIWEAFHAFDETPLAPSQISRIPLEEWEDTRIIFQLSVRLMASRWPVLDLWKARGNFPEEIEKNFKTRPQRILIGRKDDLVRCELLDEIPYRLLEGLLSGRTLGEVCEELSEITEERETPLFSKWFQGWVEDGLIRRIHRDPSLRPALRASAQDEGSGSYPTPHLK